MKKNYEKPGIAFVQLRPEERLAICSWPSGFNSTSSYTCNQPWSDVSAYSAMCNSLYNNAASTGS